MYTWFIYMPAAELSMRMTAHSHPLAALADNEAKHTPE